MKVYLKFEGSGESPAYELKVTIPEKWKDEPISKIIDLFAQNYNKKNPEHSVDSSLLEIRNKHDIAFPSSDVVSKHIHDYADLFVVLKSKPSTTSNVRIYPYASSTQTTTTASTLSDSYSKWEQFAKRFDDDDDYKHPNIDDGLAARIAREQRARRKKQEEEEREKLLAEGTPEALKKLEELEKNRKFTAEEAITIKKEKTMINRSGKEKVVYEAPAGEREAEKIMSFMEEKADLSNQYCSLDNMDDSEEFLLNHTDLLSEAACSQILLAMLDLEMQGKTLEMKRATRQYLMLRNILDLAKQLPPNADVRQVIRPFFKEITEKEKSAQLAYETDQFAARIQARAVEKKKEQQAELEEAIREGRVELVEQPEDAEEEP